MAEFTQNYKLKKPAEEDFYNVKDFNDNADIIDVELKKAENHRADSIAHMTQAQKDTLNSAVQSAIIGDKAVTKNGTQLKIPMPTAADVGAIPSSEKGVPNGVPTLDDDGYVEQLPTFAPPLLYDLNWKNRGIYVNDDGDDETGDGTKENPFKTVNKALEVYPYPNLTITVSSNKTLTINSPVYISNRQLNFYNGSSSDERGTIILNNTIYLVNSSIAFQGVNITIANDGVIKPAGICGISFGGYYGCTLQIADDVTTPKDFIHIQNTDLYAPNRFESEAIFLQANYFRIETGINLVSTYDDNISPMVLFKMGSVIIDDGAYLYNESNNKSQIGSSHVYVLD